MQYLAGFLAVGWIASGVAFWSWHQVDKYQAVSLAVIDVRGTERAQCMKTLSDVQSKVAEETRTEIALGDDASTGYTPLDRAEMDTRCNASAYCRSARVVP